MSSELLRDTLTAAFDQHIPEAPVEPATPPVEAVEPVAESAAQPEPTKAERARDEAGKFVKQKDAAAEPAKSPTPAKPEKGAPAAPAAATAAPAPAPKKPRPSSWKKDFEPHWEGLDPALQDYINERERQYATGVSTYKTEADRAKTVLTALAEFEPALQQHGIPVDKWIQSMGNAHRALALGTPQDKLATVQQILANNRIPAQLAVQNEKGEWQLLGAPAPTPQPQQQQPDIKALVQQTLNEALTSQKVEEAWNAFAKGVQEGKYPHYEEVKPTMAGLLQAGLYDDYPSAYEAALSLPKHAHLAPAPQPQQPAQSEATRQVAEKAKVERARSQAVSVRSSTPSTMTQAPQARDLRGTISEAFDSVTSRRV